VFRQLVLARIIEPTQKADNLRVLAEVGIETMSYPTLNRRSPAYVTEKFRQKLGRRVRGAHTTVPSSALARYSERRTPGGPDPTRLHRAGYRAPAEGDRSDPNPRLTDG
jgi:hypothetical protein